MLIISTNLLSKYPTFKNAGIFGMIYSLVSLIMQFLILFTNINSLIFNLISGFTLLLFLVVFLKDFMKNPVSFHQNKTCKKKSLVMLFFKNFIFIIVISNIVFVGTVGLHEFGHFSLSKAYSCERTKIVYEGSSIYTESLCKSSSIEKILLVGGFLPFLVAIFLFIFGGKLLRHISVFITGFNLVILYEDFVKLGISSNLILFFVLTGIVILITGVMSLAKSSVEDYINII